MLGPSGNYDSAMVEEISNLLSKILVDGGYGAIINPMRGTAPEAFGITFKKYEGSSLTGVVYDDGRAVGTYDQLTQGTDFHNRDICDALITCASWQEQPKTLVINSKHLVALGLSTGVNWELSLPKFYWRLNSGEAAPNPTGRIFLLKELILANYPICLSKDMGLESISIKQLRQALNAQRNE